MLPFEEKKRMRNCFTLFAIMAFAATAFGKQNRPPSPPAALPICSVLAKAAEYDGKEVIVRGIYRFEIHGSELFGEECRSQESNVSLSGVLDSRDSKDIRRAWRKIGAHEPADVVLRGTFMICRGDRAYVCHASILNLYEIEVREYLFVQPVQVEPIK
jgi:hypothetical protein